jgi:transposase
VAVGETDVSSKARHRRFSAEYKRKILSEAHGCTKPGERLGALLRREGLYSSNLVEWRLCCSASGSSR